MNVSAPCRASRHLLAAALAVATACGGARPPAPVMTLEQTMFTAADFLLECMSSAGIECIDHSPASDAWSAQGDLELIVRVPAAALPKYLMVSAQEMRRVSHVHKRVVEESATAVGLTRGLTCKASALRYVGNVFSARRELLAAQARRLGLHRTRVGPELAALIEAAAFLDKAWLVEARCAEGSIYVLVASTRELEPDDDPAAYPAAGWEAFVASTNRARLLRGYPNAATPLGPPLIDEAPRESVDAWLPVTRVGL